MDAVQEYRIDAGVHRRKREDRPTDPRPGQEEQSLGGEGKMCAHVMRLEISETLVAEVIYVIAGSNSIFFTPNTASKMM